MPRSPVCRQRHASNPFRYHEAVLGTTKDERTGARPVPRWAALFNLLTSVEHAGHRGAGRGWAGAVVEGASGVVGAGPTGSTASPRGPSLPGDSGALCI